MCRNRAFQNQIIVRIIRDYRNKSDRLDYLRQRCVSHDKIIDTHTNGGKPFCEFVTTKNIAQFSK